MALFSNDEIASIVGYIAGANGRRDETLAGWTNAGKAASAGTFAPAGALGSPQAQALIKANGAQQMLADSYNLLSRVGSGPLGAAFESMTPEERNALAADSMAKLQSGDIAGAFGNGALAALQGLAGDGSQVRNPTQWLINLLGTGNYATAEGARSVGDVVSGKVKFTGNQAIDSLLASFQGVGRGVAEGLGFRFDGERPRLWGENFEEWGVNDAIRDAIPDDLTLGPLPMKLEDAATGGLGFAADVALDPTTYIGVGLAGKAIRGVSEGAKGLIQGAGAAVREGEGLAQGAKTIVNSAREGVFRGLDEADSIAARKQLLNAIRTGNSKAYTAAGGDIADFADELRKTGKPKLIAKADAFEKANPVAATMARDAAAAAEDAAPRLEVPKLEEPAAAPKLEEPSPTSPEMQRAAAAQELLPGIRGTRAGATAEDASAILDEARGISRATRFPAELVAEIGGALGKNLDTVGTRSLLNAVKAAPGGTELLGSTVRLAGFGDVTLGDAIRTLASLPADQAKAPAMQQAMKAVMAKVAAIADATGGAKTLGQRRLLDAVMSRGLGSAFNEEGVLTARAPEFQALVRRLSEAKTNSEKQAVLLDALGVRKVKYDTFEEAIAGAAAGELAGPEGAAMMRKMVDVLGIKTKATTNSGLAVALGKHGATRWEAIKASVKSAPEVFANHGVDNVEAAAAAKSDTTIGATDAAARVDDAQAEAVVADQIAAQTWEEFAAADVERLRAVVDGSPSAASKLAFALDLPTAAASRKAALAALPEEQLATLAWGNWGEMKPSALRGDALAELKRRAQEAYQGRQAPAAAPEPPVAAVEAAAPTAGAPGAAEAPAAGARTAERPGFQYPTAEGKQNTKAPQPLRKGPQQLPQTVPGGAAQALGAAATYLFDQLGKSIRGGKWAFTTLNAQHLREGFGYLMGVLSTTATKTFIDKAAREGGDMAAAWAARDAWLQARAIPAQRYMEDLARSLNITPMFRLVGDTGAPIHLGLADILEVLERNGHGAAVTDSLFATARFVYGGKGSTAYKAGQAFSVAPDALLAGAGSAVNQAGDRAFIRVAMQKADLSAAAAQKVKRLAELEDSEAGDAARRGLAELEDAFSDPKVVADLTAVHNARKLEHAALEMRRADTFFEVLKKGLTDAMMNGRNRGAIAEVIQKALAHEGKLALDEETGAATLARELFGEQLDNVLLGPGGMLVGGLLDDYDLSVVRAMQKAAYRAAADKAAAATRTPAAARVEAGRMAEEVAADMAPKVEQQVMDDIASGLVASDSEAVEAMAQYGMRNAADAIIGTWMGTGERILQQSTSMAQGGVLGARVIAERTTLHNFIQRPQRETAKWLSGLRERISAAMGGGGKVGIRALNARMELWYENLKRIDEHLLADGVKDGIWGMNHDRQLVAELQAGIPKVFDGMPEWEAKMAAELFDRLHTLFAPNTGVASRLALTGGDFNEHTIRFGLGRIYGDDRPVSLQHSAWSKLDTKMSIGQAMLAAHSAIGEAQLPAVFAGLVQHTFGVKITGEAMGRELAAKGYVTMNGSSGLAAHFAPDVAFEPALVQQVRAANRYLKEVYKNPTAVMRAVSPWLGLTAQLLKPLQTILRPGHHMANFLGTALMMMGHGIAPHYMARGMTTMARLQGKAIDFDERAFAELVASGFDPGVQAAKEGAQQVFSRTGQGARVVIAGKVSNFDPDILATGMKSRGLDMTKHNALDLPVELSETQGTSQRFFRWLRNQEAGSNPWGLYNRGNQAIGNNLVGAYENMQRAGVAIAMLESRAWKSEEEAWNAVARKMQQVIPTRESLTAADRRVTSKIAFYYTWVRGALGSVAWMMLEHPGYFTIPSKFQYNLAEANGLEPDSLGAPFPAQGIPGGNPNIASYYKKGLLGPQWLGGLNPFSDPATSAEDEQAPRMWGGSLSAPQLDALTTFLGGFDFTDPDVGGQIRHSVAGMLNPAIGTPIELFSDSFTDIDSSKRPSDNYADYFYQQLGTIPGITNMLGLTGVKPTWTDAENEGDQQRKLINWLTGLKLQAYNNSTSARIGQSEFGQNITEQLEAMGYDKDQQEALRAFLKAQAGFQNIPKVEQP